MLIAGLLALSSARSITVGQTSDFENNNLDGWQFGQGQSPGVVNGPMDVDVPDIGKSRPVSLNRSADWSGDLSGAGVSAVRLFAENTGNSRVWLRLGFSSTDTRSGAWAVTDNSNWLVLDGSESDWHTFSLTDLTMLQAGGGETVPGTLGSAAQFRIYSSQALDCRGNGPTAEFALDDISAVPMWLLGSAMVGETVPARRRAV